MPSTGTATGCPWQVTPATPSTVRVRGWAVRFSKRISSPEKTIKVGDIMPLSVTATSFWSGRRAARLSARVLARRVACTGAAALALAPSLKRPPP